MLNKVILMGRLTADPELKQTINGISVLPFSIAVDRTYTVKGTKRKTDFINIVAWRQTAEFISRYFLKGSMIALEGSIQSRSYEDRQGNRRTAIEVVVDQAHFCGGKNVQQQQNQETDQSAQSEPDIPTEGDSFEQSEIDGFDGFEEIDIDDSDLPY